MSKRAEQAARKAYPLPNFAGMIENDAAIIAAQSTYKAREYYFEGYEQAEKDYALTKEDVRRIFNLVRKLQTKYSATDGCLQEVADIFNKEREKEIDL